MVKRADHKDDGKLRLDLVPTAAIRAIARAQTFGLRKYGARNWEAGMEYSKLYGSTQRHLLKWWNREEVDDESGLSHLDHAITCLAFLIEYQANEALGEELDDRSRILIGKIEPPLSISVEPSVVSKL